MTSINPANTTKTTNSFFEGAEGFGKETLENLKNMIPDPDITIWMGNKTPEDKGKLIAKKVVSVALPLFGSAIFRGISFGAIGFGLGLGGAVLGVGVSLLNIGKAWVINKIIDELIDQDSPYSVIKDEIKKVVDAAAAVVVAVAFLIVTVIAAPVFGPIGIFTAVINLAASLCTLGQTSYELHKKL